MNKPKSRLMLKIGSSVLLWIFCLYVFVSILKFDPSRASNPIVSVMYFIDFGVHEASHLVFAFFPAIVTAAAGSIGEMTFTVLLLVAALRRKAYMISVFMAQWVMLGFVSAGRYMADARLQQLQLVGFGDSVKHDWHFVFSQLGWLNADQAIGGTVAGIGIVAAAGGLLFGLYRMSVSIIALVRHMNTPGKGV